MNVRISKGWPGIAVKVLVEEVMTEMRMANFKVFRRWFCCSMLSARLLSNRNMVIIITDIFLCLTPQIFCLLEEKKKKADFS